MNLDFLFRQQISLYRYALVFLASLLLCKPVIGKDSTFVDRFSLNGGIGLSTTFYDVKGITPTRPPFYWDLRGSININVSKLINIPITVNISQQNTEFTHPFNQIGISPTYKNFTFHAGYSNMYFSDYSLNGLNFLGGGIEYLPQKGWVRGKVVVGRFVKALSYSQDASLFLNPAYNRWGYGAKIEIGKIHNYIGLHFFKAQDDPKSINNLPSDYQLNPSENLIIGLTTFQKISSKLSLKGEYNNSAFTPNTHAEDMTVSKAKFYNHLGGFYTPKQSSQVSYAMKLLLNYSVKKINLGAEYRRLGPEYSSMGTIFIDNNKEEYLLKIRGRAWKSKFNYSLNSGLQRTNLDQKNISSNNRIIGSLNMGYQVNEKLNLGLTYANFNTSNQINQINHADSVRYVQTTNNLSLISSYSISNDNYSHLFNFMANYSYAYTFYKTSTFQYYLPDTVIEVLGEERETGSHFFNGNISHRFGLLKYNAFLNTSLSFSEMRNDNLESTTLGPVVTLGKNLLKNKLRLSIGTSYLVTYVDQKQNGDIINTRITCSYKVNKNHSFRLFAINANRKFTNGSRPSYSEIRGGVQYRYRF